MFPSSRKHQLTCSENKLTGVYDEEIPFNPLSASPTKWSDKLKEFVGKLPTNCWSEFEHFVGLALKGLNEFSRADTQNI